MKKIISTEKAPKAVGAYSQGISFSDCLYFRHSSILLRELNTGDIASRQSRS